MSYHIERNPIDDQWKILDNEGFPFGSYDTKEDAEASLEDLIIYDRLEDICPPKIIDDMLYTDVVIDCNVAFNILGLKIENLEKLVMDVYKSDVHELYDCVYHVYLKSKEVAS